MGSGKRFGPGLIILPTAGGAWINMRGDSRRVSNERMRSAAQDESRGIEMDSRFLCDMKQELEKTRVARRYADDTREDDPRFPGDEPLEDPEAAEAELLQLSVSDIDLVQDPREPPPPNEPGP